jgi:hypothetical protein
MATETLVRSDRGLTSMLVERAMFAFVVRFLLISRSGLKTCARREVEMLALRSF